MIRQTEPLELQFDTRAVNKLVRGKDPAKYHVEPNVEGKDHNTMN